MILKNVLEKVPETLGNSPPPPPPPHHPSPKTTVFSYYHLEQNVGLGEG